MRQLIEANRVVAMKTVLRFRRLNLDFPFRPLGDIWMDAAGGDGSDKLCVVQTGLKVVQRCLLMTTDPGDLVLDPTCGSGTSAYVAEQWGRRWITTDTSRIDRLAHSALHAEGWYPAEVGRDSVEPSNERSEASKASVKKSQGSTESRPTVEKKAYVHIGPKFGTVSKQAVTEAINACRDKRDGNFQVNIVRMHDDLLRQGLLKRDKKAASFVTIGEPDIRLHLGAPASSRQPATSRQDVGAPSMATIEIAGLDIYDPIKDEIKSRDVIAYWMVDDDYDRSNFVVRQVFFCGGGKDEFDE